MYIEKMRNLALLFLLSLFAGCVTTGNNGVNTGASSSLSLQNAIERSGERIANDLPGGSRVAIVAFDSENDNLSNYIMEELTGELFDRGIEIADRRNLEYVFNELNFHMSGNVSDDTAKSIGRFLGADTVITGVLTNIGDSYRYHANAINVETAVRSSVTRLDVRNDSTMQRMVSALSSGRQSSSRPQNNVNENRTPQTAGAFLDRGITFAMRSQYDDAIADFSQAIILNPNMYAAYILRARALVASVTRVTGTADNFAGITTDSSSRQSSQNRNQVYDRAIEDLNNAIRLDPNNAGAYTDRGRAYDAKGDTNRAISDYSQAIRIDPSLSRAYTNRGGAYTDRRDYARAIADFTESLRLNPGNQTVHLNRGIAYYQLRDYNNAVLDFTEAVRLNPNDADARNNLELARRQGRR